VPVRPRSAVAPLIDLKVSLFGSDSGSSDHAKLTF
jgi:hypothetical protein